MTVHHDSGQRTPERRGYSSRPVGSCGTICTSVTTDASKITCRRRACAKHAAKVERPRRIALVIAPATDTHCAPDEHSLLNCHCPKLRFNPIYCAEFDRAPQWPGSLPQRLPECRAAEVRS